MVDPQGLAGTPGVSKRMTKNPISNENLDFLLQADKPWVVYRTLLDLEGLSEKDKEVRLAKENLLSLPMVKTLIQEVNQWPGMSVNSHKSAGMLYHKLSFLVDLGITREDADFTQLILAMKKSKSKEGLFQLPMQISPHYGGTGEELFAWALCDAPLLLYAASKLGFEKQELEEGARYLASLHGENGWPCTVCKELGRFRGPGKKDDPCPYATLVMLKLLSLPAFSTEKNVVLLGLESLLDLWEQSKTKHPYLFYMGTDFRKLKAPFIWYDILHVLEVLSLNSEIFTDKRFIEMLALVNAKADEKGLFTPESIWTAYKGWDFCQKKVPSPWLTFLVYRINRRVYLYD
jgi:hypothetical protein